MKLSIFTFKKNRVPDIESLRPQIFNVASHWLIVLLISFMSLILVFLIGAKLFYYGYSEGYKKENLGGAEELINVSRLKSAIEKRNNFNASEPLLPRDPSFEAKIPAKAI